MSTPMQPKTGRVEFHHVRLGDSLTLAANEHIIGVHARFEPYGVDLDVFTFCVEEPQP